MNDVLPCLDLLEATPAILRGLMSEISEEDARWKPAAGPFLDCRGALASLAFRGALLPRQARPVPRRGASGVRAG